jgi:tetratricopeptide (TPR) repeat protein
MPAATGLLGRALALLADDDPSRCEIGLLLGSALFETGHPERAESVLEAALNDARGAGNEIAEWRVRLAQTDIRFWRSPEATNTQETERLAGDAARGLERLGDTAGVAMAYRLLGDALGRRGSVAESVEAYEAGQRLARAAGDEREAAQRPTLGVAHGPLPVERCIELAERNLASARRPNPETMAGLGFLLAMAGRFDEARGPLEEAAARADELGIEWRLASIHMHYGAAMLLADDAAAAEEVLRPAVETLRRMGEQSMFSTAIALLAEARYRQGDVDGALEASFASERATAEDDVASQMAWRGVRAKVLAAKGELAEAERIATEAIAYADRSDLLNMAGDAHVDLGIVLEAAGKRSLAVAQFESAEELFRRKGNVASLERVARTRASLHLGAAP